MAKSVQLTALPQASEEDGRDVGAGDDLVRADQVLRTGDERCVASVGIEHVEVEVIDHHALLLIELEAILARELTQRLS